MNVPVGMKKTVYILENLGCANCAAKMERKINELPNVEEAVITYATKQLIIVGEHTENLLPEIQKICSGIEEEVLSLIHISTALSNNDTADYPGAMPYYNNKTIVFTGEGFTAEEQGEFEKLAAKYVNYFRGTEPYKEADTYFNYHTVEAVSEESGIGTTPKDTYFKLSYDKDGKIVPTEDSTAGAMRCV